MRYESDLTGKRFVSLVARRPTGERKHGNVVWECECDCGRVCRVTRNALVSGRTRSCGCLKRKKAAARIQRAAEADRVGGTKLGLLTQKTYANNTSGVKGVSFEKSSGKWRARIQISGTPRDLGRFDTLFEAAEARREAEERIFDPILEAYDKAKTSGNERQETIEAGREEDGDGWR